MQAIRQFVTVKNHQINITLPNDFDEREVEDIVLSKSEINFQLTENEINILDNRLNEPDSEFISSVESLEKIKLKYGF